MPLPNTPSWRNVQADAAENVMAAMAASQQGVSLRRLRGIGDSTTDLTKLSWWDAATTPVKVAVVAGGAVAVLGIGYGIYRMSKKRGGLSGTHHRRHRKHRRSRR